MHTRGCINGLTAVGLVLAAAASLPAPSRGQAQEPIRIGAVLSVTGAAAGLGVPERNGAVVAEKTINAKGGIKGRPIRIIVEDDTSNPDTAVTKANDLIFNQKVVTVFGGILLGRRSRSAASPTRRRCRS